MLDLQHGKHGKLPRIDERANAKSSCTIDLSNAETVKISAAKMAYDYVAAVTTLKHVGRWRYLELGSDRFKVIYFPDCETGFLGCTLDIQNGRLWSRVNYCQAIAWKTLLLEFGAYANVHIPSSIFIKDPEDEPSLIVVPMYIHYIIK